MRQLLEPGYRTTSENAVVSTVLLCCCACCCRAVVLQVSAQLVPLDAALQKLLSISGVLFVTWFFVQLKDILVRWGAVGVGTSDLCCCKGVGCCQQTRWPHITGIAPSYLTPACRHIA